MTRHYQPIKSSHPSGGSPAKDETPKCCARCRRGTPATGLGECGYLLACPNGCHDVVTLDPMRAIFAEAKALEDELYRNHPEARSNEQ